MSMSKKDFVALADFIKQYPTGTFGEVQIAVLADFCAQQNPRFMRDRWLGYIAGENGKNGGTAKEPKSWAVQGNYGQGWETVCTEDNRKEALVRLREYRENETQYSHRIVRA